MTDEQIKEEMYLTSLTKIKTGIMVAPNEQIRLFQVIDLSTDKVIFWYYTDIARRLIEFTSSCEVLLPDGKIIGRIHCLPNQKTLSFVDKRQGPEETYTVTTSFNPETDVDAYLRAEWTITQELLELGVVKINWGKIKNERFIKH